MNMALDKNFGERKASYTPCEITRVQAQMWTETCARFLYHCPAFSHLLYCMLTPAGREYAAMFTRDVPIAATDGVQVLINPEKFFELDGDERVFVLAHEVLHCVFQHCAMIHVFNARGKVAYPDGTSLPYDGDTMNAALDYVINAILVDGQIGKLPSIGGLHDPAIAKAEDQAIEVYRKLYDPQGGKGKGKGKGNGPSGHGGFDDHFAPPQPGDTDGQGNATPQAASPQEWKAAVAGAMQIAKLQGKLPAGIERLFGDILDPQVDWREHIEALLKRKLGDGGYDWKRPERRAMDRGLYKPSRSGHGCGTVVVVCDTSGSVNDKEIAMFFAEVGGILEDLVPERLVLVWCDAKVHRVDELEDSGDLAAIKGKPVPGGGGTCFIPAFDEVARLGLVPDALVYLTDGVGGFPAQAPSYPVVWGSIYSQPSHYPFGDVVMVPKQGAQ